MNFKLSTKISLFLITWLTLILLSSFILFYTFKGFNAAFWNAVLEMAIRGALNFGLLFLLFSNTVEYLDRKFPWKNQVVVRLAANLFVIVVTTFLATFLNQLLGPPSIAKNIEPFFQFTFIISFFQCLAVFLLMEGWYSFQRNRQLELSITRLEKEKLATELTALRQQVNPHFLFNSLNVLSELMHEDVEKADNFIQHFSRIYRYVLDINQEAVVTVQQEVDFLQSYLFLHKIRFGDHLNMTIQLDASSLQQYVPPLSLQLLFENAVKHNVISSTQPLHITLQNENGRLMMSNNIQHRQTPAESTGKGLQNILEKYRLLTDRLPTFQQLNNQYVASLPLIQPEH